MTALVPAVVCAAALGRAWPDDVDGQVRCIDEGTRALGLAHCCSPRSHETGHHDAVIAGLTRTPGAPPVLGVVRGPVSAIFGTVEGDGSSDHVQDCLDDASDAAVDRIRALSACGVRRAAVVEDATGSLACGDAVAESHRPLLNTASHLRLDVVLVASGLDDVERLDYDCWASDRGCSPGLGFLPKEAFDSLSALERCLDRDLLAVDTDEVIAAPLDTNVSVDLLRHASRALDSRVRQR